MITKFEERIPTRLDGINTRLEGINTRLERITTRVEGMSTKIEEITTKVDGPLSIRHHYNTLFGRIVIMLSAVFSTTLLLCKALTVPPTSQTAGKEEKSV